MNINQRNDVEVLEFEGPEVKHMVPREPLSDPEILRDPGGAIAPPEPLKGSLLKHLFSFFWKVNLHTAQTV